MLDRLNSIWLVFGELANIWLGLARFG